jgi:hypothetical protein
MSRVEWMRGDKQASKNKSHKGLQGSRKSLNGIKHNDKLFEAGLTLWLLCRDASSRNVDIR